MRLERQEGGRRSAWFIAPVDVDAWIIVSDDYVIHPVEAFSGIIIIYESLHKYERYRLCFEFVNHLFNLISEFVEIRMRE